MRHLGPVRPMAALVLALSAPALARSPKLATPLYNRAAVTDVAGVIAELREQPSGPLPGLHLIVRTEKNRELDIYVGPDTFVKDFSGAFTRGEAIRATGSKVRSEHADVILAREIRHHGTTVYLRDRDGVPLWTQ